MTIAELISVQELSAMHDGALNGSERERVREHAAQCARCAGLLEVWRRTDVELLTASHTQRANALLAPVAVLLLVVIMTGIAAAAGLGPFGALRVIPTPEVVFRGPATLARGESLDQIRAATGLPLPESGDLLEWRLAGAVRTPSGGAILSYDRGQDRLSVNVLPLASRPAVVADPAVSEEVAVGAVPALLVRRVPSQSVEAIFEHGNSAVVITADGRTVSRNDLMALIASWLATTR